MIHVWIIVHIDSNCRVDESEEQSKERQPEVNEAL